MNSFIKDRNNLLMNLDNIKIEDIEKHCKKYGVPILTNKICMVAGLHKARLYVTSECITEEMKNNSRKWLKDNGFSEIIF